SEVRGEDVDVCFRFYEHHERRRTGASQQNAHESLLDERDAFLERKRSLVRRCELLQDRDRTTDTEVVEAAPDVARETLAALLECCRREDARHLGEPLDQGRVETSRLESHRYGVARACGGCNHDAALRARAFTDPGSHRDHVTRNPRTECLSRVT